MGIKPGAYRELFKKGLNALLYNPDDFEMSEDDVEATRHYLQLLDNPNYKFGQFEQGSNKNYAPSELFFRS